MKLKLVVCWQQRRKSVNLVVVAVAAAAVAADGAEDVPSSILN
jgi:hypothetical protein